MRPWKQSQKVFVPIAAGGGVRSVDQARSFFRFGADKEEIEKLIASNGI